MYVPDKTLQPIQIVAKTIQAIGQYCTYDHCYVVNNPRKQLCRFVGFKLKMEVQAMIFCKLVKQAEDTLNYINS